MAPHKAIIKLLGFLKPVAGRVALAVLLSALTVGSSIALMMTSAWLISTAALMAGITSLGVAPTLVRGFGISRAVMRYLERLVSHDVTFRLLARLRVWFYAQIEPLAPAGLAAYRSGDLMARVVSDVEELQNFFIRVVMPPLAALLVMVIMTGIFFSFDPWLALVLLAFMLMAAVPLPAFTWWQSRNPGRDLIETRADLNIHLVDHIQGLADATAYGHTIEQLSRFTGMNDALARQESTLANYDALQTGLSVGVAHAAAVAVLAVAIPRVDGVMLAVLALGTTAAFEAFMPLSVAANHLSSEVTAAQRLFALSQTPVPVEDSGTVQTAPDVPALHIEGLRFRYDRALPPIFDGFDLDVEPGERVALIGESGIGKTSLVNVLLRQWDYEAGTLQVGSVDLRDYTLEAIREIFGVMRQRTHLFNITIMENIRIANKAASDEMVIAAAKRAQIHDFIEGLPQGYATAVGEDGAALSGGERQRVALARVILKDAPIWVLDEATANLDAETEREVMAAIDQAAADRTLLVIAHRLPDLPGLRTVDLGRVRLSREVN